MEKQSLFRDFLIKHEWARKEYRELKETLWLHITTDRVLIYKCKAPFIQKIIRKLNKLSDLEILILF